MPRIAILSDVHSNLPALEAVLREVESARVDGIVFGGDLVGYGASPRECMARIRSLGAPSVLGNHDFFTRAIFARGGESSLPPGWPDNPVWAGIAHALRETDGETLEWLWSRPLHLGVDGGVLAHASLNEPDQWHYLTSRRSAHTTLGILRTAGIAIGFFGHTHQLQMFYDETLEELPRLVAPDRVFVPERACCALTVGSVGQPRDPEDLRASWIVWDAAERLVEIRRTTYPAVESARAILAAALPLESALRLLDPGQRANLLNVGA